MTTPRSREEIEDEQQEQSLETPSEFTQRNTRLILEVLLDIRDALTKKNPTDL